jgi:hypothetical protein
MSVKTCRKKAEEKSVWAIVLKEALIKLSGPYAEKGGEGEGEVGEEGEGGGGGGGEEEAEGGG